MHSSEIVDALLTVAFDADESGDLREHAISTLAAYEDKKGNEAIKKWVLGAKGRLAGDDIRGEALRLLWPKDMTAVEMFSILTEPINESHIGVYQDFLNTSVASNLSQADLPCALAWCERHSSVMHTSFVIQRLVDGIFLAAWPHLAAPDVATAFALAAIKRLKESHRLVSDAGFKGKSEELQLLLDSDHDRRRTLCLTILRNLEPGLDGAILLLVSHLGRSEDFEWLVGLIDGSQTEFQKQIALLSRVIFNPMDPHQFDLAHSCAKRHQLLADQLRTFWDAIDLDSELARDMRDQYQRRLEMETIAKRREALTESPPIDEIVKEELDRFEAGDFDAWWQMSRDLGFNPKGPPADFQSDLRKLSCWDRVNAETRQRVLKTAATYLERGDPHTEEWFGTGQASYALVAGCRALRLLENEAPESFRALNEFVWKRWTPAILSLPAIGSEEEEVQRHLAASAYAHAPTTVVDAAFSLISAKGQANSVSVIAILDILRDCRSEPLWSRLLDMLRDHELEQGEIGAIFALLLQNAFMPAREYALELLAIDHSTGTPARQRALVAGRELLFSVDSESWSKIWTMLQSDEEFGKELILMSCEGGPLGQFDVAQLAPDKLADLFIWIESHFPSQLDPDHGGQVHAVSPRDSLVYFRNGILQRLKTAGSESACTAIEKIKRAFPKLAWLQILLIDAKENARRAAWIPPQPDDFLALVRDSKASLVRGADELLSVVVSSIGRLQSHLTKGEPPRARLLWDESIPQPKDESALSDFIKSFLDNDLKDRGIVLGRELQIYPSKKGRGASIDIHVDAVAKGGGQDLDRVKTIIEVKGCWHAKLKTDIKDQLVDDYLAHSDCDNGIYVVGWFDPTRWSDSDARKKQVRFASREQIEGFLRGEAKSLSTDGREVRAIVLDCNMPTGAAAFKPRERKRKAGDAR